MTLSRRPVEVHSLPLQSNAVVLHPERVVLRFERGISADIGARCYECRAQVPKLSALADAASKSELAVDPLSLSPIRIEPIGRVIQHLSRLCQDGGKRLRTVHTVAYLFCRLIDWCDAQGHPFILQDRPTLRSVFKAYVDDLRDRAARSELLTNTAAQYQLHMLALLSDVGEDDALGHGISLIRIEKAAVNRTQPPNEAAQGRVLALAHCIFAGLSELVLGNMRYPFALKVPPFVEARDNVLWVFPSRKWCMPPHEISQRHLLKYGYWAFDYESGRIATPEEIWHRYIQNPKKNRKTARAELCIGNATRALDAANRDQDDPYRRNAALTAHNAFVVLFLAHTGMNWATTMSLAWGDGNLDVGVERQGFRTIKYRAMGRTVSFEIQPIFLPVFRRFLEVRAYLLEGEPFDYLFVASGDHVKKVEQLSAKTLTSIVDSLARVDPKLTPIMSKEWRAGKSDWLLRHVDPSTAALVLQNSEYTVLQAYAEGSPVPQAVEMGAFLSSLEEAVIERGVVIQGATEGAVGVCTSYGNPNRLGGGPVPPDCRAPEGCLFCDKLRVHADEHDVGKLLSCRFCLDKVAQLTISEEQAQAIFGSVRRRLDALLQEIDRRESGIVARIEKDVAQGELDPYWAAKLELLLDLELVV